MSLNTRREFVGGMLATRPVRAQRRVAAKRPNILFIISDEWSPVATDPPPGERMVRTPVTDGLAASGISFRKSYCAYPVCSPARASLFTGRMPHENGVFQNVAPGAGIVPRSMPTLGELFSESGYACGYFGKEHTGGAAYRGFKHFGSLRFETAGNIASGAALDPIFTRDAIEFIRTRRRNPFLAVVSLINPHDICALEFRPAGSPRTQPGQSSDGASVWQSIAQICGAFDRRSPRYLRNSPMPSLPANFRPLAPAPMVGEKYGQYFSKYTEADWQLYIATYYLLMENTDWMIGRLLEALRQAGLEDDTLVVFTADHGDHMGAHRLYGKSTFYEESARVPCVLAWKGVIKPGQLNATHLVSGVDILPTLCDFAGIRIPPGVPGRSLRPVAESANPPARQYLVSETSNARMVRTARYKYIAYRLRDGAQQEFLYDLEGDPGELRSLTEDGGSKTVLEQCRGMLNAWMKGTGGTFESTHVTEEVRKRFRAGRPEPPF